VGMCKRWDLDIKATTTYLDQLVRPYACGFLVVAIVVACKINMDL
jgi:hypothetical protein